MNHPRCSISWWFSDTGDTDGHTDTTSLMPGPSSSRTTRTAPGPHGSIRSVS
ncbi:hypothetical protein ACIHEJ_26975 [Streptomyces sp. NPDC052301]|uniref:hypothetical protein n=1 Tax=Streptomyces sp. NPDC052301 TaxID=3365687 RepID=UPI0037D13C2E